MTRKTKLYVISASIILICGYIIYSRSNIRKLQLTNKIYQELAHPDWSVRILRDKAIHPTYGSGDQKMLYLIDARRSSIPIIDAIAYYESETDRLGFRECHVDTYESAHEKFHRKWARMGLDIPQEDNIIIISQNFTSNSTIRRSKPMQMPNKAQQSNR